MSSPCSLVAARRHRGRRERGESPLRRPDRRLLPPSHISNARDAQQRGLSCPALPSVCLAAALCTPKQHLQPGTFPASACAARDLPFCRSFRRHARSLLPNDHRRSQSNRIEFDINAFAKGKGSTVLIAALWERVVAGWRQRPLFRPHIRPGIARQRACGSVNETECRRGAALQRQLAFPRPSERLMGLQKVESRSLLPLGQKQSGIDHRS